jgi:hypothetical protein
MLNNRKFIFTLALLVNFLPSCNTEKKANPEYQLEVVKVVEIFRHGARTPIHNAEIFKTD